MLLLLAFAISLVVSQTDQASQTETDQPPIVPTPTPSVIDAASLNLHRWGAVTLFHGLPSDRVNAIAEDASGVMWFGTDNGLVRYDGRNVEPAPGEASLPSRRILALNLDARGNLWIGTDAGAACWHNERIEVLEETRGRSVNGIAALPQHEITLVTGSGEIFRYADADQSQLHSESSENARPASALKPIKLDPSTNPYQLKNPNTANEALPLAAIERTNSGEWAIASSGRGLLIGREKDLREAVTKPPRPYFLSSVYSDGDRVWLGEQAGRAGGLWMFSDGTMKRSSADTGAVTAISGSREELWIGTARNGVFLLKPENDDARQIEHLTFENTAGGLRSNQINAIYLDGEGVVWFGTDRGICRYDRESFRASILSSDANSNFVRDLLQSSSGELWCGTNRGLFKMNPANDQGSANAVAEIQTRSIYSLFEDQSGAVWAGTSSGLFVKTKDASTFARVSESPMTEISISENGATEQNPQNTPPLEPSPSKVKPQSAIRNPQSKESVRAIAGFRGQTYAAIFERGIERIDGNKRTPVLTDAAAQQAICLAAEADRALWFGTTAGELWSYDGSQLKRIELPFKQEAGKTEKAVRAIVFAGDRLWVATSQGVFVRDGDGFDEVLSNVDARDLLVTKDAAGGEVVWCATQNAGLIKLLPKENLSIRFDTEQGLASQQVFALSRAAADGIWIGTSRGVVRHQPSSVAPRIAVKRLVAETIYRPEDLMAELALPHTQRNFVLEVIGLGSKTFPSQFQYEFSLQSRYGDVYQTVKTHDPQFQASDLKSGGYKVVVKAVSRDLVFSEPMTIRLRIQSPPFPWTTIFFAALAAVALAAAVWAFRQQLRLTKTNRTLAETNSELQETRLRLASETEAERSRIARDLHDQTLADLRHLLVMTDQLPATGDDPNAPSPTIIRREIESVSREIRRICEDLSPSALENIGFLPALEWALDDAVAHLPAEEKFAYEFDCEPELEDRLELSQVEQIQLYRIVQEALNNICRHARAKKVKLSVRAQGNDLLIEIRDDGVGFDGEPQNKTGHGLANIRSRANLVGAQVLWQHTQPGCRFELRKFQAVQI
ncbi:MAG: two-component regulator propeller domain-containing protein [Blastocatellales bacterium]